MWRTKSPGMNRLQQLVQGKRVLHDWLGEGGIPVPINVAQARADVCNDNCPKNYHGSWLWNIATSMAIASQMKLRRIMGLKLNGEKTLDVCEVCGCVLKLKVHVPFEHIYRHMSLEQFSSFPPNCWMLKELEKLTKNQTPTGKL